MAKGGFSTSESTQNLSLSAAFSESTDEICPTVVWQQHIIKQQTF
jgi:hypothetical protein